MMTFTGISYNNVLASVHYYLVSVLSTLAYKQVSNKQGAKKIIFTACHSGKLKLAFTSPDVISTSPQNFLTSRIDFIVLLLIEFHKKLHLPVGQVKNRIHWPRAIGHYFLCTLVYEHSRGTRD